MSQFYWVAPGPAQVGSCQQRLSGDRERRGEAWGEKPVVRVGHSAHCQLLRSETVDSNDTMAAFHLCFNILNIPSDGTSQIFLPCLAVVGLFMDREERLDWLTQKCGDKKYFWPRLQGRGVA